MANAQAGHRPALLDEALGPGGPIIVFDNVWLAFDDKVILRDVSFTLADRPYQGVPRRERGGKVDHPAG